MTHPKLATSRSGYGGRGYRIPGRTTEGLNGKPKQLVYPSITTVLNHVAKPALHQWIADCIAAYAVKNVGSLQARSEEVGFGFLRFVWNREPDLSDPLRTFHDGVKNDAAELGTNIHEYIEADLGVKVHPDLASEQASQMAEAWDVFLENHSIESHNQEFTVVYDGELPHAGTADADWTILCLHDDPCLGTSEPVRCLIDLKSSRHTWNEHGMQLAAIKMADRMMVEVAEGTDGALRHEATVDGKKVRSWWVETDLPSWDRYALLHIRPNDLDPQGEFIPAFCKLIDRTRDMDLYERGFRAAREQAEVQHLLTAREKSSTTN